MARRSDNSTDGLVRVFAALADVTRLRLLNLMQEREVCVCYFVEVLGQSQPKISRHLAYLRRAGVVLARREGKWMHYRIDPALDSRVAGVVQQSLEVVRDDRQFHRDMEKLAQACCQPQKLVSLHGAPVPQPF